MAAEHFYALGQRSRKLTTVDTMLFLFKPLILPLPLLSTAWKLAWFYNCLLNICFVDQSSILSHFGFNKITFFFLLHHDISMISYLDREAKMGSQKCYSYLYLYLINIGGISQLVPRDWKDGKDWLSHKKVRFALSIKRVHILSFSCHLSMYSLTRLLSSGEENEKVQAK